MVKTYIFRYMYKKGLGLSQILLSSVKVTIKRIKTQNCNRKYSKQVAILSSVPFLITFNGHIKHWLSPFCKLTF